MAIGDVSAGVAAAMAVGFALLNRERTGAGQYIDASLIDTYFHMHELCVPLVSLRPGKFIPKRAGSMHPTGSPVGVFQANGGYLFLVVQQHEMPRLWAAMGRKDLGSDPRFATLRDRMKNNLALKELIESVARNASRSRRGAGRSSIASACRARRSTSSKRRWPNRTCASAARCAG